MTKSFQDLLNNSNIADEIIPRLFLGSQEAASNKEFIKKYGITAVINATPTLPNYFQKNGVNYVRVPVDDSLKSCDINKMTAYLPFIVDVLKELHHNQKKKVLVHCHAGMQRSAIIIAAYLVKYYKKTPMEAIRYIISKRPVAFMNGTSLNFIDSLQAFAKNLNKFKIHSTKKYRTDTF